MRFRSRDNCPACKGHRSDEFYACSFQAAPVATFVADYYGAQRAADLPPGTYRAAKCRDCGLLYQVEVGDDDLLATLYGDWLDFIDDPMTGLPGYAFDVTHPRLSRDGHEIMTGAAHLGQSLPDMVTFDFGMGWAGWARVAAALGCRSYGSELSENRMRFAAKHGVRTISLEESAGIGAHFINAEQVFEHLTDPSEIMSALVAALAPGGILKIGIPAPANVEQALQAKDIRWPVIMPLQPLEHVNCYSRVVLCRMGAAHGLQEIVPSLGSRFAFLWKRGLDLRKPKNAVKELVRPFYTFNSRRILTIWLQKPA